MSSPNFYFYFLMVHYILSIWNFLLCHLSLLFYPMFTLITISWWDSEMLDKITNLDSIYKANITMTSPQICTNSFCLNWVDIVLLCQCSEKTRCCCFFPVNRTDEYFNAGVKYLNEAVNSFYIHFNKTTGSEEERGDWAHSYWPLTQETRLIFSRQPLFE